MRSRLLILAIAFGSVIGCGKTEEPAAGNSTPVPTIQATPPSVTTLTLASKVDAENNPANTTTTFSEMDTVWAVADVVNMVAGTVIEAHWVYTTENEEINTNRVSASEPGDHRLPFFIAKTDGWPVGDYKVDIVLNGAVAKSQVFTVK